MDIEQFFNLLFKPGEVVEFRPIKPKWKGGGAGQSEFIKFNGNIAGKITEHIHKRNEDYNLYFGVMPRLKHGEKSKISRINTCFVDIDSKDFTSEEEFNRHIQTLENEILPSIELKYTAKINSGHGFHYYFVLSQDEKLPIKQRTVTKNGKEEIEFYCDAWRDVQCALIDICKADQAVGKDLPRILRLPGSINIKEEGAFKDCKIIDFHKENVYRYFDFLPVLKKHREETLKKKEVKKPSPILSMNEEEIINKLQRAKNSHIFNKLYSGDWIGYNSQSEADLALCNLIAFYTQDEAVIDSIFRHSGLYRDKWDREDYNKKTIQKAIEGQTGTYNPNYGKALFTPSSVDNTTLEIKEPVKGKPLPPRPEGARGKELEQEKKKKITEKLSDINSLNYDSAIEQDNKIEDNWIVENLFARGVNFSVLFGEPGVCKTWLILSEFLKLADGKNIFGKYETEPRKTVLLEADFPANVFEYRLKRLYKPENIDNFHMYSADKLQEAGLEYCMDTAEGQEVIEKLMEREKPDMLIIDSLGSWIQGDEVKQDVIKPVIEFLKKISHKFNLHILLIHHPRKRSNVERLNRLLDMSDATGSFLLARYASSIYTVNGLYDEEGRVENKGLVINVKNWFKTSPKFEFSMEQNEDEKMEFTFEYKDLTSFKDKKIGTKEAVIENLKNNPEGLTKKQFIKLIPNVSQATIERALRELKKQKKINSIGNTSNLIYKLSSSISDTQDNEESIEKEYTPQGKELSSPLKRDEASYNEKKLSISCLNSLHPCREFNPIQDKGKDTTLVITCVSKKKIKCSTCEHGSGSSPAGYHICKISPDRSYPGQVEHDCIDYTAIDCIKEHKQRYNEALRNLTAGIDIKNCKDIMRDTIGNLKAMGIDATDKEITGGFELCRT